MADDAKIFAERWRVIERIGGGGQGVVYKVADMLMPGWASAIQDAAVRRLQAKRRTSDREDLRGTEVRPGIDD